MKRTFINNIFAGAVLALASGTVCAQTTENDFSECSISDTVYGFETHHLQDEPLSFSTSWGILQYFPKKYYSTPVEGLRYFTGRTIRFLRDITGLAAI